MSTTKGTNFFIDLKVNGRLFPSWILYHFKKYKLEKLSMIIGDPCTDTSTSLSVANSLHKYQLFIADYIGPQSPYTNVLLYHGLGSGKTATAINVCNVLIAVDPDWIAFILIKSSLKGGWLKELQIWLAEDNKEHILKNIVFIHYDSPQADKNFFESIKSLDSNSKVIFIIDEVHNFIRNVYSNMAKSSGRAYNIYEHIIRHKRDNPNTRTVLISATPAVNYPYELALLFNLLRPNIFPDKEDVFNNIFISKDGLSSMNISAKNMFQRRILGLVSYYQGATPSYFASRNIYYFDVVMSPYQEKVYDYFEKLEKDMEKKSRFGTKLYKSYTRQTSNFVFPPINDEVDGFSRPRPNNFRLNEQQISKLNEGRTVEINTDVEAYRQAIEKFLTTFEKYMFQIRQTDIKEGHFITEDIAAYATQFDSNFTKFAKAEIKKSNLFNKMYECSAKMTAIVFNLFATPGPAIVYSNYVLMEGLQIFKIYLKLFGLYNFMDNMTINPQAIGFIEFHGGITDMKQRYEALNEFNKKNNKDGTLLKAILISAAGAEGLNLKNVTHVHIMEPYWNEVRIAQLIGRAIRLCSHADLPMDQRHVKVYRYKSLKANEEISTDQYIEDSARAKESVIQSFLDAMKEASVDCGLNKPHNEALTSIKCFQFNEPSLFSPNVGPAYKQDIEEDKKYDNGSNSLTSNTIKIKVLKIQVVTLTKTNPDTYSEPFDCWYSPTHYVAYDYDLFYPIGKISLDSYNIPRKLSEGVYILTNVINYESSTS